MAYGYYIIKGTFKGFKGNIPQYNSTVIEKVATQEEARTKVQALQNKEEGFSVFSYVWQPSLDGMLQNKTPAFNYLGR